MTVSSEISEVSYDTDGVTTAFPVPFYFLANDHLRVWLFYEDTGVEIDLVLGSSYLVTGAGNPAGGTVTTSTAYPAGPKLRIERVVPITQETAYQRNDPFPERAHERALDKLTMICQQLAGFFGLLPGSTLRALLLGRNDADGGGAYRAKGNRIQDLGAPVNGRDATTMQWVQEQISNAAIDGAGQFVVDRLGDQEEVLNGAGMVGFRPDGKYPIGTAGYQVEGVRQMFQKPAIQATQGSPTLSLSDNDWTFYTDSLGDALYRHSARIVRDISGQYHMVYSRGKMHGYGGLSEANAVDPESRICYTTSRDLLNWTPEYEICSAMPADSGLNPFRSVFDCHIGVTPSGRLVVAVSDVPPPSTQWGRYTGNTRYRLFTNDQRGANSAWVDRGVFYEHTEDYARVYGARIKIIPKIGGGERMVFTDYRRLPGGLIAIGTFFSDDEFETLPVRGADAITTAINTEGDITMLDAHHGVVVARGNLATAITNDGCNTWTYIGNKDNFDRAISGEFVAPIIEAIRVRGEPRLLLGWSERTGTRSIRWMSTSYKRLLAFRDAVVAGRLNTPWSRVTQSGPAFTGSAGYHSPVLIEDGACVYSDVTETTVDPSTGFMRAQVRITRFSTESFFPHYYGQMIGSDRTVHGQYNEDEIPYVPVLIGTTSTGAGTITEIGTNTRDGNRCVFNGTVTVNGQTGYSGTLRIAGLPYRSVSGMSQWVAVEVTSSLAAGWNPADRVAGLIISDSNYIALFRKVASTQALTGLGATDLGTNFSCHVFGNYKCRFTGNQ